MSSKYHVESGFTLLELMIVVAIIGILAAIAIPQYQDYVMRAKWQDTIQAVADLKIGMSECYQDNNEWASNRCTSLPNLSSYGYTQAKTATATKYGAIVSVVTTGWAASGSVPAPGAKQPGILLNGAAQQALNRCQLVLVPVVGSTTGSNAQIKWYYVQGTGTTAGFDCKRRKTGVNLGSKL